MLKGRLMRKVTKEKIFNILTEFRFRQLFLVRKKDILL